MYQSSVCRATLEAEPLPSGKKKYINTTLIPDLDGNAQVRGFHALNADTSDYKRAGSCSKLQQGKLRALFTVPTRFVLTDG